jgi:hypothetical protein
MYLISCQADRTKKFPIEWSQAFPEYNLLNFFANIIFSSLLLCT